MFDLTKVTARNIEQRKESKDIESWQRKYAKLKKRLLERTATMASETKKGGLRIFQVVNAVCDGERQWLSPK